MRAGILLAFVCVVGAETDLYDVFNAIKVQFENAWVWIKNFMKRPTRKTSQHYETVTKPSRITTVFWHTIKSTEPVLTSSTSTSTTTKPPESITEKKTHTMPPDLIHYFQRTRRKQVLLPLIATPRWRSRDEWYDIQQPDLTPLRKDRLTGSRYGRTSTIAISGYDGDEATAKLLNNWTRAMRASA